ncbi:gliding motility-associated C-terminal domain-containing protein [Niastella yeongjuensis]|nr:gliding motility-associated C-terminal domain-containing protein [Niastella yeongjuensis]
MMIIALLIGGVIRVAAQSTSVFEFTENTGQWEKEITFKGILPAGNFYLQKNGFTVVQHNVSDLEQLRDNHNTVTPASNARQQTNNTGPLTVRSHAYKVQFVGASPNPEIVPDKILPGYSNYLIGNDRTKWRTNVRSCQAVVYKNVYPNIDVRYYSESGRLKYDIIVNPGGDVNKIAMQYDGADKLSIKKSELVIKTSLGDVRELYPYSYLFDKVKGREETPCAYKIDGKIVRFKTNAYSKTSTLVIDPTIIFSSFTGTTSDEWGFTATPGPDGSFFSGSISFNPGFPTSPGAYKTTHSRGGAKGIDIGIFKFSANGGSRMYATYLGGGADEFPHSLICDAQGNLVVMGRTYSTDFSGAQLIGDGGGCDMFVTKLNATGTGLIGSLRIGGQDNDGVNVEDQFELTGHRINGLLRNYGDDSHSEVIVDDAGYIYVAGQSQSAKFPTTPNTFQPTKKGAQDGVLLKIDPTCNSIVWSTFLGGTANDAAFVLAINPANNDIYVAGGTESGDFPGASGATSSTILSGANKGYIDGYVTIISSDGTTQKKTIYLGTEKSDILYGIQFDRNNYPYVLGVTRGDWPVINATYSNPGTKQFIVKLSQDLNNIEYSTTFGSGNKPNISPVAFLVDRCENVYVSGWGGWYVPASTEQDPYDLAGTRGMPVTPDALKTITDNRDFYFIVLKRNAESLLYGSFFGQDGGLGEHVDGGTSRFDRQGAIYQAICANCYGSMPDLPITKPYVTTAGVWAPKNGAGTGGCNLGALKILLNFSGVGSGPKAYFKGVFDTVGCVPFTVNFKDTILDAQRYIWHFGDGTPDEETTSYNVTHEFKNVGVFRIALIAIDSASCNIADTAYLNIHVRDDPADILFSATKLQPCQSLTYEFVNKSVFPPRKPFNPSSFIWDFGDGTRVTPADSIIHHNYSSAGTYLTRLILTDTAYCNAPDSTVKELRVSPLVDARFETPASGCAPYTAIFNNTSLAGEEFYWDFGDGSLSNEVNPAHLYSNIGNYRVKLRVVDTSTCNKEDSTYFDITVYPKPVANFSYAPVPPSVNKPIIFTNLSSGAVEYQWNFGDNETITKKTADTVSHQYNATGTFEACLVAISESGCTDTLCKEVEALIDPLLDVPNAFTPGRFGRNGYISITGFGIAKMTWKIYNRWGKVVFETHDRRAGWDGTVNGQLQPMDVYAYTLDVEFFDGKKVRKTGDITLIK